MHEVGVAREMLKIALDQGGGRQVVRMKIALADDGHTTPESLTHAFAMVARGTPAEGARLTIERTAELESRVIELDVQK
ncbi:MAG TPA: hydrogenase/urease maturation nickel metallochaperone HypA [Candidatus Omnitrophota bacterium]|nr:hydrogenase/urease maturation nickel metallochaperone HypA [Candidatus Omnitrophota bacterium]